MIFAHFTEDMAQTLVAFFEAYASDGVVTLQVVGSGLWLVNPHNGSRQFLGQARLTPEEDLARQARQARPLLVGRVN